MIESGEEQGRDLSRLVVSRAGLLVATGDDREPYRVVGSDGDVAEPVSVFLRDLLASGKSEPTLRSYSVDLLRWWRFLTPSMSRGTGRRGPRHGISAAGSS